VAGGELPPPERPEGLEAVLQDMKWVIRHNAQADHTEAHRNWRRLLGEDLKRFFRLLTRLELLRLKTRSRRR
jgi:hypothetical protein